jgi:nicotinic acid mononucleotide adenylyltransferase
MDMKTAFAFGRMNPITKGHKKIIDRLRLETPVGVKPRLYLSQTYDRKRNPLTPEQKVSFVKEMFPDIEVRLAKNIFDAGLDMAADGFDEATLVVGEDRFPMFSELMGKYSGSEFLGLHAKAVCVNRGEGDASSSQARSAASMGDYETFKNLSASFDELFNKKLYEAVCFGLEDDDSIHRI